MKSRINWDSENNVYVESKAAKRRREYFKKIKTMRDYIKGELDDVNIVSEGTKVKLNYDSLVNEPVYKNKLKSYKQFIEDNKDTIFTVEYDEKYKDRPILVCLKEDTSSVKWLWNCETDLIVVDNSGND